MKIKTTYPHQVGDQVHLHGVIFDKVVKKDGTYELVAEVDDDIAAQLINDELAKEI